MAFHYNNESFNLYVGTDDADNDKRLIIKNVSLPDMEEMTQNHHAGGSFAEIEVGGLGMKALAPKFKSAGWDPQTMSQFGIGSRSQYPFIIKSKVRNLNGGAELGVKAVIWGRLTKLAPSEMKRGDAFEQDYEIKEVLHYELYFNNAEKYFWDYFTSTWRVDGANQNQGDINYL